MNRESVTQTGREAQHDFLAKVSVCAIVDTVAFVSKMRLWRSKDEIIDLQVHIVPEEMACSQLPCWYLIQDFIYHCVFIHY